VSEATPIPAHLGSEFLLWLWFTSERQQARFDLPKPVGGVDVWVDDRLAFRLPADQKVTAVLTGENPAAAPEARAALSGGKVLQDLRVGVKRDDREFSVTLRGAALDVAALKLPAVLSENPAEAVSERMFLVEELQLVLVGLFRSFAEARASDAWPGTVRAIQQWLAPGAEG
jgi:hypothetical protein